MTPATPAKATLPASRAPAAFWGLSVEVVGSVTAVVGTVEAGLVMPPVGWTMLLLLSVEAETWMRASVTVLVSLEVSVLVVVMVVLSPAVGAAVTLGAELTESAMARAGRTAKRTVDRRIATVVVFLVVCGGGGGGVVVAQKKTDTIEYSVNKKVVSNCLE